MKMVPLKTVATIDISNVDKKCKEGESDVILCNFVDVYHNWAITQYHIPLLMKATANKNQIERFSIHKGQVAITKDSETRDDIGVATYIADEINGAVLGYHCALISPDENILRGKYLNIVLHSPYAQKYFEANASGSGQRYTLTAETIGNMPIPIPEDINIQDSFGSLCSAIDVKIENNTSICSTLESMAKLLYDYWFVQFDFPDENGKPYKSSGGKMVWNEALKREIPEGWRVDTLGSIIKLERGISYSSEHLEGNGIPMINLGSFAIGGGYKDGNLKTYNGDYTDQKIIKPYDLLICLTQQTSIDPSKDVIGCAMTVPDIFDNDIVISQDLAKLVCSEEVKFYLFQYFNTTYFHKYITGFASGSNILHLDVNGILIHKSVIPAQEILMEYSRIVRNVWEKHSRCIRENQQLASLRDFLLPMLMNGQVKVCN